MRIGVILHIIGGLILAVGLCMAFPVFCSLYYGDAALRPLLKAMVATCAAGGGLTLLFRREFADIPALNLREGMTTVGAGWIAACLFGALPYVFAGTFPTFADAVFESFSGFSTTGSSVMTDIEATARSILLWRGMTHWLGGMGIIVLSLAILPYLGVAGMQLYRAEVPGPIADKFTPRLKDTAKILWQVYVLLTVAQTCLLAMGDMDLFEALVHSFATVATGGFSTRNASLGAFGPWSQWVCTVFMFMAGINFLLHYTVLSGRGKGIWRDDEFRFYSSLVLIASIIAIIQCLPLYDTVEEAVRTACFQVVSIITTTGFATADYMTWAPLTQFVILFLMFSGGSAGSTAGGVKCMRILVVARHVYDELLRMVHPSAVRLIKFNNRPLPAAVLSGCISFISLFVAIWFVSALLLAACGVDIATAGSGALTCLANVGPGFGAVGPANNFAGLPAFAKWILSMDMLLGRLEIFALLVFFFPEFWRR